MATDEDRRHTEKLRREKTRRLHLLEERAARQGISTDPATLAEIEDLRADIAGLEMVAAPSLSQEVRAVVRRHFEDDLDFLIAQYGQLTRRQMHVEEQVDTLTSQHHAAQTWRLAIADDVQALKQTQVEEKKARKRGQRWNRVLLIAIIVLVIVGLAARALYL